MMSSVLSPIVVDAKRLPRELLERAGLEHEPLVIVESTARGELVRRLTPDEKNEHQERTGESVFFASEQEFDEAMLAAPYEGEHQDQGGQPAYAQCSARRLAWPARLGDTPVVVHYHQHLGFQ
jgi:hypothetical protein